MYKILILIILLFTFSNLKSQIDSTKIGKLNKNIIEINETGCSFPDNEVNFNEDDFQKSVIYPDSAKREGIQGLVVVQALIDSNGIVKKANIKYSVNKLLNNSAINAVLNFKGFTPDVYEKKKVATWIYIPINFKL